MFRNATALRRLPQRRVWHEKTQIPCITAATKDSAHPRPIRAFLNSPAAFLHATVPPFARRSKTAYPSRRRFCYTAAVADKASPATTDLDSGVQQQIFLGVDPDLGGALAVLQILAEETSPTFVAVVDVPVEIVKVGKFNRRRHHVPSIVAMIRDLDLPYGCTVFLEQARPFPSDGKQGWFSTGYGAGVWEGVLNGMGFQ
ncbi:hypothetical protein CYMTET_56364, partial [Cymbomonas tetramitiformis]